MTALLRRHAPLLCALLAWAGRVVVALTDWAVDEIMARLGESMLWEDVERLAQDKIEEEHRRAEEFWRARARVKPQLRLLQKP
jgi:hypothetical protein